MRRENKPRFLYHAHAIGLAASLTKPTTVFLDAQPVSALPVAGGRSSARVENFRFQDIISYRLAETQTVGVSGTESGTFSTVATVAVEGLNILNVLTADRIVARLASRHFLDEDREPSILTLGSHFENLKIGGREIKFDLDRQVMSEWHVFTDAVKGWLAGGSGRDLRNNRVHTSIVSNIQPLDGCDVDSHSIHFPDFGTVFLGELQITRDERRLTMLRVELGCAYEGDVTCAEGAGNGSPAPPLTP
ncbi:MAG: hypothetical protein LAQ69_36850 [Acidobacteriia bacterium]|nr:hypothetical protein [Terriglobia bacterium]